nr:DUF885 domain-containing protein [Marinactinospora thermotolerans]
MTDRFREVSSRILDALLEERPEWATELGDDRFDDRLTDHSEDAGARRAATLADALGALDEIDDTLLPPEDRVDLELLRTRVSGDLWRTTELRPHTWDPLEQLPGEGLSPLIERESAPAAVRLERLAARCAAVPDFLSTARSVLDSGPGMPRVHVETAIARVRATAELLTGGVDALLADEPSLASRVLPARDAAREALSTHAAWLAERLDSAVADPRLGARDYAAQLWYTLDSELSPETLLTRAESDLLAAEEEIAELAAEYEGRPRHPGQVRRVLDRIAERSASEEATVRPMCEKALEHLVARTAELDLVTVPDTAIRIVAMPGPRRGVCVAYCDPPGPLAPRGEEPTTIAVAPPPGEWPAARRASFHREYNSHMLRNLMVHEAVPGHALQLAHAARYQGATRVRTALRSGSFVEGWAVYAEDLIAENGWGEEPDLPLRLTHLKMRLRTLLNAIIDVRVHAHDLSEAEAMELLTQRGHQEEGEAAGKWRRALLTSAQLATYYVGHREIAAIARDLAAARPADSARRRHDAMLAHGSPSPRHLRALLGV